MNEPRKIADRPHFWTITLSVVAIAVSLASFYQSRQAVRISREVSRAVVQVNSLHLADSPGNLSFLKVDLTLGNYGQMTARNVSTTLEWDISDFDVPVQDATDVQPEFGDIAPKSTKTVRLQANRLFSGGYGRLGRDPGLERQTRKLLVYGVVHYTDEVTELQGSEPWCFFFESRPNKGEVPLDLRPCDYRPHDPEKKR